MPKNLWFELPYTVRLETFIFWIQHLKCVLDWEDVCASENVSFWMPLSSYRYESGVGTVDYTE